MQYIREAANNASPSTLALGAAATATVAAATLYAATRPTPMVPPVDMNNQSIRLPVSNVTLGHCFMLLKM